jgi:hypothetical protein
MMEWLMMVDNLFCVVLMGCKSCFHCKDPEKNVKVKESEGFGCQWLLPKTFLVAYQVHATTWCQEKVQHVQWRNKFNKVVPGINIHRFEDTEKKTLDLNVHLPGEGRFENLKPMASSQALWLLPDPNTVPGNR